MVPTIDHKMQNTARTASLNCSTGILYKDTFKQTTDKIQQFDIYGNIYLFKVNNRNTKKV